MIRYSIYNAQGYIVQAGVTGLLASAEAQARRLGLPLYIGEVPPGHIIVDGAPVPIPDAMASDTLRAELKAEIDHAAGQVRALFITAVPGQDLVYAEKRAEAERILAGDQSNTPHLSDEAADNGRTLAEQAAIVSAMAEAWRSVSRPIERRRLNAKSAVDAAVTESEARAAAAVDWSDIRALADA